MLENIGWILVIISAVFQGLALRALGNMNDESAVRKKKYIKFLIICLVFFIPGAIMLVMSKLG